MSYSESTIDISPYKLQGRKWKTDNAIGCICLIHGIGEHSARYEHWALRFNKAGYSFFTLDLPGHGTSNGKRGHINRFGTLMQIVEVLLKTAADKHPGLPVILYGHSMGGLIACRYLLTDRIKPTKAVLTSPWLGLVVKPASALIVMAKVMQRIFPGFMQKTELEHKYISHVPEEVEKYKNDPLIHYKVSVNTAVSMLKAIDYIFHHPEKLSTQTLILHGSDDMITSPDASEKFSALSTNAYFISMPGLYHEMHNEANREDLFDHIIKHISKD